MEALYRWYVVHTHTRSESVALHHLGRQNFTAFLPQYEKRRRHARKVDWVRAPLFPGYLFVSMDVTLHRWRAIASTIGVTNLVCNGDTPAPVPQGIVEGLQIRANDDGLIVAEPKIPYRQGEQLQVLSGAFADQVGFFDCATDEERVILLLDLLGRQVKVRLPLEAVAPVA